MKKSKVKRLTFSAMIAALYFACCFVNPSFASGAIQCRVAEGFSLLPLFFPEAIIGVTIGCLLFNVSMGIWWDIVFGTLATFLASIVTYFIGRIVKNDWLKIGLGGLSPVLFNALIIPFVLAYGYDVTDYYWFLFLTVGAGELIAVYVVGIAIYFPLKKLFLRFDMIENA